MDPLSSQLKGAFDSRVFVKEEMLNNLLYCDDLVIFGEDHKELQRGVDKVYEFCQSNQLIVNQQKTKMISCNTNGRQQQRLIMDGQTIEVVETWKYLGFHMNNKGNTSTHAIEMSKRCSYPIFFLRKLASMNSVSYYHLTKFLTAMIDSVVLYASEAWGAFVPWNSGSWDRSLFERANFKSCKAILQVNPTTDNIGARLEVGRLPLLYNIQCRSIRYWASIGKRPESIIAQLMADATYRDEGLTAKANSDFIRNCRQGTTAKTIRMHKKSFQNGYNDYMKIRTEKSSKLSHFYYTFKNPWTPEKYLVDIKNPKLRQTLAKFRLGNHKLAVETLRYVRPKIQYDDRKCALCRLEVENEIHFLFKCP